MKDEIIDFLTGPHVGMSSKAICKQSASKTLIKGASYPRDPADFNRCQICLDQTDIDIEIMRGVSKEWTNLVDSWNRIKNCFIEEAGYNWNKQRSAPNTYDLMKKIISHKG